MKKFILPFPACAEASAGRQNMVRADLFSGSLTVWNARGFPPSPRLRRTGAIHFARQIHPSRAKRGEEIRFEQFQEYTASQDFASGQRKPRGGSAAARPVFQKVSGAKTEKIYQ